MTDHKLSDDARVVIAAYFAWGEGTKFIIGGAFAQSVLSERGRAAMAELLRHGYITVTDRSPAGRVTYQANKLCNGMKMSTGEMNRLGKWRATEKNPARVKEPTHG